MRFSTPPRMIPKKNGDTNYKYNEVVRKKDERSRMHGADCPCCRKVIPHKYYPCHLE